MRLKSFTAPTTTEALAQIRAVLGDNAIIVATREDDTGGVCVTAAIDEVETALEERRIARGRAVNDRGSPTPSRPPPTAESAVDAVYRAFRDHGVPALIGERLLERVAAFETSDPVAALAAALRQTFRFAPTKATANAGRPRQTMMMMIGPPGAGKTQTVAKLAARGLINGQRVGLVTTDTERTGGTAPLIAFAEALKLPLLKADAPATLSGALGKLDDHDLVVIDSAGRNHLDPRDLAGLGRCLAVGGIEPVLVVPAGLDPIEAADIALAYQDSGVRRLVTTRLDVARRLGSTLAAAYAADVAFADFAATPRIKDGLTSADPLTLARLLLPPRRTDAVRPPQTGTL